MSHTYCDIIIVGSGMSGLYTAYNIKKTAPKASFLILEKFKKQWVGGRTSNEFFYGVKIVTGAGIGRKDTNPLLIKLMNELHIKFKEFTSVMDYSRLFQPIDIVKVVNYLKKVYKEQNNKGSKETFKQFCVRILGKKMYKQFSISAGYTDYENADLYETLYNYGMDDNKGGWTGLYVPWKKLVDVLYEKIGSNHFKFHRNVVNIRKIKEDNLFEVTTENGSTYYCRKVVIASTISTIQKLVSTKQNLYRQIHGQPFLRLYGKFTKKSATVMKEYAPNYTIVPGPLQKIIPMNSEKGVYMIAYSDNENAVLLQKHLKNTLENRNLYCRLIEKSLGITEGTLQLTAIKDFYWPIGTHYYEPLQKPFLDRDDFLKEVQHPEENMLVVGEAVSRYQGWVEGALESVESVLTKKWINSK